RKDGDDPVQSAGALEVADFSEAQQLPLAVLAVHLHGFDERQVGVGLVATLAHGSLDIHTSISTKADHHRCLAPLHLRAGSDQSSHILTLTSAEENGPDILKVEGITSG